MADQTPSVADELRDKDPASLTGTPVEIQGKTPQELARYVDELDAALKAIHQDDSGELREKTVDEQKAFDYGLRLRAAAVARIEEDKRIQEIFRARPKAVEGAMFNPGATHDPGGDVRRMSVPEARDNALRILDSRMAGSILKPDQKDQVERSLRRDTDIARRIIVTENDAYRAAYLKAMTDPQPLFDDDERRALQAYKEFRALSEGTSNAGGYGVPVFIDPSIILTAQGSGNPFLQIASTKNVTTNAWKGITSAGVSWSFDAESSAVSDDSPTLAQPVVNVRTARGFIPYSIEVGEDYPGFADEVGSVLGAGYDELLLQKFSVGGGDASNEPNGILTALDADSTDEVLLTTAGAFGSVDFYNVWQKLPQRFRRNASFMMTVDVNNAIRQFGTANNFHATTVQLTAGYADTLFNKPVYESPYFPGVVSGTSHQNVLVVGDFSNYIIARRGGMSTELVPTLFDVTNNRPTGQRGIFAYARIGGNVATTAAFKLLNQT